MLSLKNKTALVAAGVEVRESKIQGRGLYATRKFLADEIVISWANSIELSPDQFAILPDTERPYVEFQEDKIILVGEPERYVNHSCDPNTRRGERCDIASRDIKSGEEITCDYANFTIPSGQMACACGAPNCRKIIVSRVNETNERSQNVLFKK